MIRIPQESDYTEDSLVEQPAIELLSSMGWQTANCFDEFKDGKSTLGRDSKGDVILLSRLRPKLRELNPTVAAEAIELAIEALLRDRSALSLVAANKDAYKLIKDGVKVTFKDSNGEDVTETIKLVDFDDYTKNDFFLASQFWIAGDMYTRRTDLLGFVNGIPLVFIELKTSHKNLKKAFDDNLTDYKTTIPQLFWYNGLIVLSNGSKSKVGSVTAGWDHFSEWKKINSEGEEGVISLETTLRAICDHERLLDIVENFVLFKEAKGGDIKVVAKNHQYLGVNRVIEKLKEIREHQGKLGVFWHTQGSGKSFSMIFFSSKALRKLSGKWTFLVVTDRDDLDNQIYKDFVRTGTVTENRTQAKSGEHLKQLLQEDHRYIFTLIQKFRTAKGEKYPELSDRSDIVVIADEAHRTQYDVWALNMRNALPKAAFIGFTGTPLIAGEEKTKEVFGDYVSVYTYKQSTDDEATVPLFYENRIPELQLTNDNLNEDMGRLLEEAELNEEQEKKLEREFAREYHLITRDERLDKIAADIATHFFNRGFQGKAMVVSIDKATAVKMYDKVKSYVDLELVALKTRLTKAAPEEQELLRQRIDFISGTDMAVIVSQSQNEIAGMKKKGVDIVPHRRRMVDEDLEEKFKDEKDPLRLVFVCAMWMTGFDVPSCSTVYLDKPMRNHTLMQTITRANRRFGEDKKCGLIVDYVGVFRNLQKALAIYAVGPNGKPIGESPVKDKAELVEYLKKTIAEATAFCESLKIDLTRILKASGFDRVKFLDDAVDAILVDDETKRKFLLLAGDVARLYRAILPDPTANEYAPICVLLHVLDDKIRSLVDPPDISAIMGDVESLLDRSVATEGYVIREPAQKYGGDGLIDLSQVDFEALQKRFAQGRKNIEIEKLKNAIHRRILGMVNANRNRMDYLKKFEEMIEEYNSGSRNVEELFRQLVELTKQLQEEEKRAFKEQLSEEELAAFDLLTKPDPTLTKKEQEQVKAVVRELLAKLKKEVLVLDWRKRQQSRALVRVAIEQVLDTGLPEVYSRELFARKTEMLYQHVYESYFGDGRSVYAQAA